MRRALPSQDAAEKEADAVTPLREPGLEQVWQLIITVVASTGISKVHLPFFNRDMPLQGTKEARNSLLKLLSGMNKDVCPLNYRGEYKRDSNEKDVYYPFAPGWTTLSGGNQPKISLSPVMIYDQVSALAAARCVPMVKTEVKLEILEPNGTTTSVSISELRARNIQVQPVPRLAQKGFTSDLTGGAASSSASPSSSSEAQALRATVDLQARALASLEEKIAALTAAMNAAASPTTPASIGAKRQRHE